MAADVKREPMVQLVGEFTSLAVPPVLYHGTCSKAAERIMREGLCYQNGSQQSKASRGGNYLATSLAMAASYANSRAWRTGGEPIVVSVQAHSLMADALAFDLNVCARYWSEALVYHSVVPPNLLTLITADFKSWPSPLMLLGEPTPNAAPVAIDLTWEKANLFC